MADDLTDEERELLAQHRASKRPSRKVTVRGQLDSGAAYEFEATEDESDRIIRRHPELLEDEQDDEPKGKSVKAVKDDEPRRFGGRRVS